MTTQAQLRVIEERLKQGVAAAPNAAARPATGAGARPAKGAAARGDWEFLWRFIAVAMLFEIGWVIWIAVQINPPLIALPAAYEAFATARANRNLQGPVKGADPASDRVAAPTAGAAPDTPREPPVNVERLKLSESIETAIPGDSAAGAEPRPQ